MTLGTNATLAERLIYAPGEIDTDELLAALHELEEWRGLDDELNIANPEEVRSLYEDYCSLCNCKEMLDEWLDLREIGIEQPGDVSEMYENLAEAREVISDLEAEIVRLNGIISDY